jgi:integrase
MKINSRTVAVLKLPANAADVIHFDSELVGFGCRLRRGADGKVRKSYVVQYRRGKQTRRIKLDAGNALSAEQARAAAKTILAKVALGDDPQAERLGRRDARSLRSVVDEYLAARQPNLRPGSYRGLHAYLTGSYLRPLHTTAIDQITRADVAGRLVVITREHSSNVAAHARAKMSALFTWAMAMGFVESNPVIGTIRPEGGKARKRVLTDDELAKVWRACQDDDHGRIVRLLVLTGCRRQEVGGATWTEFDFDRGIWTIPGARSKNHHAHTLPLPAQALAIIAAVPRIVDRDYLFGVRAEGFLRWADGKAALDARAGVADWVLHDIRRTVATRMADLGVAPHVIEAILNHQSGHKSGIAGTYNRSSYANETRAALALWADHVTALVSGRPRKITAMRRAARAA